MNVLMIFVAVGFIVLLVLLMRRKLKGGSSCCGEHEALIGKVKAVDANPKHYPNHYCLSVGGMVCANCARRVENAFHQTGRMLATVDLGKKEVQLSSLDELDRQKAARLVDEAGYTLLDFKENQIQ